MSEEEMIDEVVEEKEMEVLEFGLDDEDIDELMGKLNELKANKGSFEFDIDDDYSITVHYEEPDDSEEEGE